MSKSISLHIQVHVVLFLIFFILIVFFLFSDSVYYAYFYLNPIMDSSFCDTNSLRMDYKELVNFSDKYFNYKVLKDLFFIPTIVINLPLYLTDWFYILLFVYVLQLILIPLLCFFIYKWIVNFLFLHEIENYKIIFSQIVINFIFLYFYIKNIIIKLLNLSLYHNENLLLFEFDIQFNIQTYVYICLNIILLLFLYALALTIIDKYLSINNLYFFIFFMYLFPINDFLILIIFYITFLYFYYIYFFIYHYIKKIKLIKFYQVIVKRKI